MKSNLTILMCFLWLFVQAQSFEASIKQGDQLYDQEKYLESAQAYDRAFELKEGSALQYYNAACSFALYGDTIQSIRYLNLSADKGWYNIKHLKRDKDLISLYKVYEWTNVLEKVQANLNEYEKDFDKPLKQQLEKIHVKDQTLRQLYRHAEEKFGKESEQMNYFWELMAEQDSLNEIEVLEIIESKGWVGRSVVGGQANMALWLVIQHAPLEIQRKHVPLLKESVLKGESSGRHLALLEDRILTRNNKPQTYGSQIGTDDAGKQYVYEVREPEYVNQRRKEIGLGPIESYVKRWGIEWTIEQKER